MQLWKALGPNMVEQLRASDMRRFPGSLNNGGTLPVFSPQAAERAARDRLSHLADLGLRAWVVRLRLDADRVDAAMPCGGIWLPDQVIDDPNPFLAGLVQIQAEFRAGKRIYWAGDRRRSA